MNIKEFAKMLDGRQYRSEMIEVEEIKAKQLGYVIVFGASDDLMEFRGAIYDEVGCFGGGTAYLNKDGLLEECECQCKYYRQRLKDAYEITAHWCHEDADGFTWSYETEFQHETFRIFEGDDKYCLGIVFDINEL